MQKDFVAEMRIRVSQDVHDWVREASDKKGVSLAAIVREALDSAIKRSHRNEMCRSTDPLIRSMSVKLDAVAEKLGVELPENQPDSEAENSAEKEGEIH